MTIENNDQNIEPQLEIFLGLVCALGTDRSKFLKGLTNVAGKEDYVVEEISLSSLVFKDHNVDITKSLEIFLKMELINHLRKETANSILIYYFIEELKKRREKNSGKKVIYVINQLKNINEYRVLSFIYGLNYIQVSLFSNNSKRLAYISKELSRSKPNNCISLKLIKDYGDVEPFKTILKENDYTEMLNNYKLILQQGAPLSLIEKDFNETNDIFIDENEINSGQEVSKLFHESHYYFNLDREHKKIKDEIEKFFELLIGVHEEYPTQDEFCMALASDASYRSNFPGKRHVGAVLASPDGEIISVASVRAPSKTSNPKVAEEKLVEDGYFKISEQFRKYMKEIGNDKEIKKLLKSVLDFHPCTHAEISAILDAAKIGTSTKNSTIYSTTFPCHICSKDILNAGVIRLVYLEAYPKSKTQELYGNLICFNDTDNCDRVHFQPFVGIGPKRYSYVYSLRNKRKDNSPPPLIEFEYREYYEKKENDVHSLLKSKIKNRQIADIDIRLEKLDKLL